MFDYEYEFEELPIKIDGKQVGFCNGTACLVSDDGYDFVVMANAVNADDGDINLSERADCREKVKWFRDLAAEIYACDYALDSFNEAKAEYYEAA